MLGPKTADNFRAAVDSLRSLDESEGFSFHSFSLLEDRRVRLVGKLRQTHAPNRDSRVLDGHAHPRPNFPAAFFEATKSGSPDHPAGTDPELSARTVDSCHYSVTHCVRPVLHTTALLRLQLWAPPRNFHLSPCYPQLEHMKRQASCTSPAAMSVSSTVPKACSPARSSFR